MRRSRARIADVALALLLFGVVCLGVAVALAVAYPEQTRALYVEAVSAHPPLVGVVGDMAAATESIVQRAREGWEYRFVGTYERVAGELVEADPPLRQTFPEDDCLQCHPYFRERPLFSVVYFSHGAHLAKRVRCERCHAARGPTRCEPPAMSGCGDCHEETSTGDSCNMCHPYGSLFHGAALAGDREIGEQCVTCHIPARLVDGARVMGLPVLGDDQDSCAACHESAYCGRCHPSGHEPGYSLMHAVEMRARAASPIQCYACHSPAGCAGCHTTERAR